MSDTGLKTQSSRPPALCSPGACPGLALLALAADAGQSAGRWKKAPHQGFRPVYPVSRRICQSKSAPSSHAPQPGLGADCWNANTNATLAKGRAPVESAPCFVTGFERCAPGLALLCQPFSTQVYRSRYWHNAALMVIANRADLEAGPPCFVTGFERCAPGLAPPFGGWSGVSPFHLTPIELCLAVGAMGEASYWPLAVHPGPDLGEGSRCWSTSPIERGTRGSAGEAVLAS